MLVLVESLGRENIQEFSKFTIILAKYREENIIIIVVLPLITNHYVPTLKFPPFTVVHSCGNLLKKLNALGFIHIG